MNTSGKWISENYQPGLVSVIIPTYNRAHFIGDAIRSVVEQTYPHWECIVVDDGSTDDTAELVRKYVDKHGPEKMRYFYQEHQGVHVARNKGIQESRGEFIQYLDSDDFLCHDKLKVHVEALQTTGGDVAYGPGYCLLYDGDRSRKVGVYADGPVPDGDYLSAELRGWHTPIACPLYRRHVVAQVGQWDVGLQADEDYDYVIRVGLAGFKPIFDGRGAFVYRHYRRPEGFVTERNRVIPLARTRVIEKTHSALLERGLFNRYRPDLSCLCLLSYVRFYLDKDIAERWLEQGIEMGPPSKPAGASSAFLLFWSILVPRAPRLGVRIIRFVAKVRKKLFFTRRV